MIIIKTKTILLIMVIGVMLFTSCSNGKDPDNNNNIDNDMSSEYDKTTDSLEDASFTLIMPETKMLSSTGTYTDMIEAHLKEQGFNINIDIMTWDKTEDYKEYIKLKLGEKGDMAFLSGYFSRDEIKDMADRGWIMEISEAYKANAPRHFSDAFSGNTVKKNYIESNLIFYVTGDQDNNKIFGIPIGEHQFFDYTGLLVRKEISERYGKDLDSFTDYESLLRWIRSNEKQYKPGLFPVDITQTGYTSSKPCYDFWAHVNGYSDISGLMGAMGTSYYKNNDINSIAHKGSLDIMEAVQLPDFKKFIQKLREWSSSGLVELWTNSNYDSINPTDYATIVTNIGGYTNPWSTMNHRRLVNVDGYDMYLFNKAAMKYSTGRTIQPVASTIHLGANTQNPRTIMNFIDWLYSDPENYNLFMYGEKGVDYTIDNNRISFEGYNGRSAWGEYQFDSFTDNDFLMKKVFHPDNWEDILEEISNVPHYYEISLNNYALKKNDSLSVARISELRKSYVTFPNRDDENERKEYTEFEVRTTEFLEDMLINKDNDPDVVFNEYIKYIIYAPAAIKRNEGYTKYINELFRYIKDNSK